MRLVALIVLLSGTALAAQAGRAAAPEPTRVEMAPIECYWRASTPAVRVGERFTLVLTCGVIETASTTVIVEQTRLDPGAIALQPFEVLDGTLAPEMRTATHRFFQYEYHLRYVGEEIGRDHQIPSVTLSYRVQSRTQESGAAIEGRQREYRLPAHAIRILSLIPAGARDIREVAPPTFASIEDRRFTGTVLRVSAWVLFALAGTLAAFVVVRGVRRRQPVERAGPTASAAASLRVVARELDAVRVARAASGWNDELAARALAAFRVAAAYAADAAVAQGPMLDGSATGGQLQVHSGWLHRRPVAVSASTTVLNFKDGEHRLADTLRRFTAATYGRHSESPDGDALDEALSDGIAAVSSLRRRHSWLATRARTLAGRLPLRAPGRSSLPGARR